MDVGESRLRERGAIDERLVKRVANAIAFDADAARRVALRIRIDEQRFPLSGREGGREVHSGRRFADAALLVRDGDYTRHVYVIVLQVFI